MFLKWRKNLRKIRQIYNYAAETNMQSYARESLIYVPILQKYLHMVPIDWKDWLMVIVSTLAVFFFEEARKAEGNK